MVANTDQKAKVSSLCTTAITLVQKGSRTIEQKQRLFDALKNFTGDTSLNVKIEYEERVYPGRFGNRCSGCGGCIDDGGHCHGGTDHWSETPGACGTKIQKTMSIFEQLEILTHLCSKTMQLIGYFDGKNKIMPNDQENVNKVIKALQDFKDGSSARSKQEKKFLPKPPPGVFNGNRCTRCGGFIDEGGICPCGYDHALKVDYGL